VTDSQVPRLRRSAPASLRPAAFLFVIAVGLLHSSGAAAANPPGGFIETPATGLARPRLTQAVLQALMPARGGFTFPAPYLTSAVRLTNATDCGGGDCVDAVGYSYWRNINNHAAGDDLLILLGLNRARGGPGPSLFRYNKVTGVVTNLGAIFDPASGHSWHSTEGWYFSGTRPTQIYLDEGSRMRRYDVFTHQYETVFDVAPQYGADKTVWQMHSSDDDRVHSATLRSNVDWEMLGCVVYHEDTAQFQYFPKIGNFNECSVDKSGRWLMSLEDVDGRYDLEMRIFDLQTGAERLVWDQDGAVGHADMGFGYVVGSDNWNAQANAVLVWDFARNPLSGSMVSHNLDWSAPAPNHIAHGNARAGVAIDQQFACGSGATRANAVWGNEIICFRLDGSQNVLVVAPVMTDLDASGGGGDDYVQMPKGNLDLTGRYFLWTSNVGGNRLDAFLVQVPGQLLVPTSTDVIPPTVSISAPAGGATVTGAVSVAASAADAGGMAGVQFRLDGALLGAEDTAAPYQVTWDTASAASGGHSLTAVARDVAGNTTTSLVVTVTVPPPDPGPNAFWPFGEGSGTAAADASGHGHAGAVMNGAAWIGGPSGGAIAFDGVDDYVQVPNAAGLDPYPLTLTAWVRTTAAGLHGVVNKYQPGSLNGYQIFVSGGNLCAWYFRDTTDYVWDGSGCTLATPGYADGAWHHVALVIDAAGGRLYVDGVQKATRGWTGAPGATTSTADLNVARYPGTATPYLPGSVDEVRLYGRALAAAEIAALASPGPGGGPGEAALLSLAPATGTALQVTYAPACGATGHVVYLGTTPIAGALAWQTSFCGLGTSGTATFDPGVPPLGRAFYFVIAGQNGVAEGSYGHNGSGAELPEIAGVGVCDKPQVIASTCP
jgi:hypothetical protein